MFVKCEFITSTNNLKEDNIMTTKFKVCFSISVIIVATFVGYALATLVQPPEFTEDQIQFYESLAKDVWDNGLQSISSNSDILITSDLKDKTVTITPNEYNGAQSLTVDFNNEVAVTTISCSIHLWGNTIFYGIMFILAMYGLPHLFRFMNKQSFNKKANVVRKTK